MKAIGNKIIVLDTPKEKTTESGIVYSQTQREPIASGKVVCVGANVKEVFKDDTVLFDAYAGTPKTIDGVAYRFITEDNVFAVV